MIRCKRIGGSTLTKLIRNVYSFLFSVDVQRFLSWSGANNKLKIRDSSLFKLIEGKILYIKSLELKRVK